MSADNVENQPYSTKVVLAQDKKDNLLTKPAKVPTWTRDITLETYIKQLETWTEINEDVSVYVK